MNERNTLSNTQSATYKHTTKLLLNERTKVCNKKIKENKRKHVLKSINKEIIVKT